MPDFCFISGTDPDVTVWSGNPDCQAAHNGILDELVKRTQVRLPDAEELNTRVMGNLGEFICFFVGKETKYAGLRVIPANAFAPLANIAKPDLDLLWLRLPDDDSRADLAIVQEVKTTASNSLDYARELVPDYDKLFGEDPRLTLHTRLSFAASVLEFTDLRADLAVRAARLAGVSPSTSPCVRITPTIVHDKNSDDPRSILRAIRTILVGNKSWADQSVEMWAIGLSDLRGRLTRLAKGCA